MPFHRSFLMAGVYRNRRSSDKGRETADNKRCFYRAAGRREELSLPASSVASPDMNGIPEII